MSFLKKFFEPALANKVIYFKGVLLWIAMVCTELWIISMMQKVAVQVQSHNIVLLQEYALQLATVLVIFYSSKWFTRAWNRPDPYTRFHDFLIKKYYKKILISENSHIEKIGTGKLIEIMKSGTTTRIDGLEMLMAWIPQLTLKLLFACWIVYQASPKYALGFVAGLVILSSISVFLNSKAIQTRSLRKEVRLRMAKRFVRFLASRIEILQSGKDKKEIEEQCKDNHEEGVINTKLNVFLFLMYNIPIFCVQMLSVITILYAIHALQTNSFSYSTFTGLVTIIGFMTSLIIEITGRYKDFTRHLVDVEKLREYINDAPLMQNFDTGNTFDYKKGSIELKNLSFQYNDGIQVFDNFSLSIQGGKKTAFVGNSGSGKSTLVKLISGLLSPDKGQILIDGQDLSTVSLKSFYQHIGFLQQEPIIFDGTVKENILYSLAQEAQDIDIDTILKQSQCDFVYALPHGMDTEVGERGVRLSGGQKQRLAIARIFAKNPDIIILDEPTSALDSFAEEEITKALHALCKHKTVLIIAHRLQTVKEADEIIVLGQINRINSPLVKEGLGEIGKTGNSNTIIERGTHSSLIAQNGHYAKMLELQAGF